MSLSPEQAQVAVGVASSFFALVLVVVTALYYFETRKHTAEMKRSRKPVLKMNLVVYHSLHARLTIENIGRGTARNIEATWGFTDADFKETFHSLQLDPDDRHMINRLPFEDDVSTFSGIQSELGDREGKLKTTVEFKDEFGESYRTREIIDVKKVVDSRVELEQPEKSEAEDLIDALEDIVDAIESRG